MAAKQNPGQVAQCFAGTLPDGDLSDRGSHEPGQTRGVKKNSISPPPQTTSYMWMDMQTGNNHMLPLNHAQPYINHHNTIFCLLQRTGV